MTSSEKENAPRAVPKVPGESTDSQGSHLPQADGSSLAIDPFNLDRLRLSQDFESRVGVRKALITVPVRKPNRQAFIRVHPDLNFRLNTAVFELKEEKEVYLVDPELWPQIPGEITPKVLFTAIDTQNVVFIWPIRLPGADGRLDEWNRSALEAATMAMKNWLRVASNRALGAYEIFESEAKIPDPQWPNCDFKRLLEIAFRDRFIQTPDHPVLRRLRTGI
jgi:hypothetical protein